MTKISPTAALVFASLFFCRQIQAAYLYNDFYTVYRLTKAGDMNGLQRAVSNGIDINANDSRGENTLCYMVYQKDYQGYELLKSLSADTNPACLERMDEGVKQAFFKTTGTGWGTAINAAALVGVAGVAAGVALGSSGGGGSGGDGGDTPPIDCPAGFIAQDGVCVANLPEAPLDEDPSSFVNGGFTRGNFLTQIGAEYAYGRGYTGYVVERNEDGSLTNGASSITSQKVKVAVYDNGVSSANPALQGNLTSGFNFDYGPCGGSNANNCYQYDEATQTLTFLNEQGAPVTQSSGVSAENWQEYISKYAENYDWDADKDNSNPHEIGTSTSLDQFLNTPVGSHGTHVAGIIAANGGQLEGGMQGVAPNAQVIPVIMDPWSNILNTEAMNSMVNAGAKVVNMSFGYEAGEGLNSSETQVLSDFLTANGVDLSGQGNDALSTAFKNNVVLVMSAGNEAYTQSNILSAIPELMESAKGLFVNVVAVAPDGNLANYSNHCGSTKDWCLAAPGGNLSSIDNLGNGRYKEELIYSTVIPTDEGAFGYMQGTSMAAPVVTGSVALMMGAFPYLTPQQIVDILFETATDLGETGVDDVYGHGLINLDRATKPVGTVTIPTENTTEGKAVALADTRMSLPQGFEKQITQALPGRIMMLDKYQRAYPLATASLFRTADSRKTMEHDMRRFVNHVKAQTAEIGDKLTFSYSERTTRRRGDLMMGSMDMAFKLSDRETVKLFYTEDTSYDHGNYFSKALANPFINMNNAFGFGHNYRFNDRLAVDFSLYSGENGFYDFDDRLAQQNDNRFNAFSTGVAYSPSQFLTVAFKGGMLKENGSVLGMRGEGGLATADGVTTFTGVELTFNPRPELALKTSYFSGTSKGGSDRGGLMRLSDVKSDSFALGAEYKLDESRKLGLQISSPLSMSGGRMHFNLPVARDAATNEVYREQFDVSLHPEKRELNIGTYFVQETADDNWFQAEVGARINPDHQADAQTDYRLMLGWGARF